MKLKNLHITILFILLLSACEEYYVPEVEEYTNALVVECILTDKYDFVNLKLSRTTPFNERSFFYGEKGAKVTLKSESGESFGFSEFKNGVYQSSEQIQAKTAEGYYLHIETKNKDIYTSGVEIMMPPNEIEIVHFTDSVYRDLNYNYWGEPIVNDFKGIFISVLPKKPENPEVGYLYKWSSLINYKVVSAELGTDFNYFCWKKIYSNALYVYGYNDKKTGNQLILDNLNFFSYYSLTPFIEDSSEFEGVIKSVYPTSFYYLLEQYTITQKGADFWKSVKKQSEASGKLFDPIEEDIGTNMQCISDENKACFGYFNTASFSTKMVRVGIQNKDIKDSVYVDFFPFPDEFEECLLNEFTPYWYQ